MSERFSLSQEEEALLRQTLFRKAKKGDEKAKQELQKLYGMRLWSEKNGRSWSMIRPNAGKGRVGKRDWRYGESRLTF
jgi:hypothetical protein